MGRGRWEQRVTSRRLCSPLRRTKQKLEYGHIPAFLLNISKPKTKQKEKKAAQKCGLGGHLFIQGHFVPAGAEAAAPGAALGQRGDEVLQGDVFVEQIQMHHPATHNVAQGPRGVHLLPYEELQELPDVHMHLGHLCRVSVP